ncbi:transcriptional regulator, LacI family [Anaerocolumna jejuensis DSM 15929]|uniref:Transcriptional regulator, LacI family n=1 Tax=Anaerocolumna jejuensis DSM 15929 TaxID=1121322 RepID=A0A1M6WQG6_9FIRM|nr:substrate-binding domain-containing protein [Anaerocolumna jejuensis]SHK95906.1 transcriptional regulator, LacI family [Anaerocolumna jejuensis DSM 15929]
MKNVTMKDIADKLNISTVTVSKALSDKDGVSEELKNRIKKVSEEMGYRYNVLAKSMKEGKSYNVGIVIADRFIRDDGDAFYLKMYQSVVKSLSKAGYYGIMEIINHEQEKNIILPSVIQNNKVDGVIILGQMSYEYVSSINNRGIPLVFLDFYDELLEVDSLVSDSFYGSYILTNHLIAQGHRNIGFVGNILSTSSILDRYLGYYKSLLSNGIPLREEWVIADRSEDGTYIEIEFPKEMPTAFVCNNDGVAYLLINKLKKNGYRVPEDISVVGFDNYIFATISNPKLTTVEVDITVMSDEAVKAIVGKINNANYRIGRVVINGKLIIRDSVKKIN